MNEKIQVKTDMSHLKIFCERASLDFSEVIGDKSVPNFDIDPYILAGNGEIRGLIVRPYGRFGNNIIQISHAIQFARRQGLDYVQAVGFGAMFRHGNYQLQDGLSLRVDEAPDYSGGALEGRFFFWWGLSGGLRGFQGKGMAETVRNDLRQIIATGPELSKESAVHCHIRGGDVFKNDGTVNPDYVQPPLSYYVMAIDKIMAMNPVKKVVIVTEDRRNPIVENFLTEMKQNGLAVWLQSSTEKEDIGCLLSARKVICGFGTFMPAIALLSMSITDMTFFRVVQHKSALEALGIKTNLIQDLCGGYIQKGAWRNTTEQRELMIKYPLGCLGWGADA